MLKSKAHKEIMDLLYTVFVSHQDDFYNLAKEHLLLNAPNNPEDYEAAFCSLNASFLNIIQGDVLSKIEGLTAQPHFTNRVLSDFPFSNIENLYSVCFKELTGKDASFHDQLLARQLQDLTIRDSILKIASEQIKDVTRDTHSKGAPFLSSMI